MRKLKILLLTLLLALAAVGTVGCASAEPLSGFSLAKSETALYVGETETLLCNFYPADAANRNVFWNVEDDRVASVDADGNLTGKAAGQTTVYAESYDGGYRVSCKVRVYDRMVAAEGIRILVNGAPAQSLRTAMSDTDKLVVSAEVLPAGVSNGNYALSVADETVIRLDRDGTLIRGRIGATTVTATSADGAFVATLAVETTPAVTKTFSLGRSAVLGAAGMLPVRLTPVYSDPNIADKAVVYTSDDPGIATVDADGVVRFVSLGETTIRARHTATGLSAATAVKVVTPIIVTTAQQLQDLDKIENDADTLYLLGADIDLVSIANFNPIGYDGGEESPADSRKFQSTLDGNGYTIRNLNIDRHGADWGIRDLYNAGLFVYIGAHGNVRNLTIEDATVYARITGIVAGSNEGVIENCLLKNVRLDSTTSYNGLICGSVAQTGTVVNCIVTGAIAESATNYVVAGRSYGYLENVVVASDAIPQSVLDRGITTNVIDTAHNFDCRILSAEEMLADAYAGFSTDIWTIATGKLPTLKHTN